MKVAILDDWFDTLRTNHQVVADLCVVNGGITYPYLIRAICTTEALSQIRTHRERDAAKDRSSFTSAIGGM